MTSSRTRCSRPLIVCLACLISLVGGCTETQKEGEVYRIAAILPVSGPNAAQGIGMMNSSKAAIADFNTSGRLGTARLELVELDDESDPEAAVRAAERAAQDQTVVAVTAHWNSGCALATNPVFHRHGLANLVPAAINSKVTLEQAGEEIFRIDPHDLIIVEYAAKFAFGVAEWRRVFVIDDNTFYGKELARKFVEEFTGQGGSLIGQDSIQVGEKDFNSLLTRAGGMSPDLIFFGGVVTEAALIRRQMESLGSSADFMSLTGIHTESFIDAAGPAAEGVYSVTVVPPIELLPGGESFEESYGRHDFRHPYEAWGVFAYASIEVLGEAIARAAPDVTRNAVIRELQTGEFETVLGRMTFDEDGQTTLVTLWVYEVQGGEWTPAYRAGPGGELIEYKL